MIGRDGSPQSIIGRAKAALVFGEGEDAAAVVAAIHVEVSTGRKRRRLTTKGTVALQPSTSTHLKEIVIPLVDRILVSLGLPPKNFLLSPANIGAASARDIGLEIRGYSCDVPIFLASLSAALRLPIPQDVISTGHIASLSGDISAVRSLDAKLRAASGLPAQRFMYPSLEHDNSIKELSPEEAKRYTAAVAASKGMLDAVPIADIAELVEKVFPQEAIVQASLLQGFYKATAACQRGTHPSDRIAAYLTQDNERRFWSALENHLLGGQSDQARDLLEAYSGYHAARGYYPESFGSRLLQLVCSLPPTTRRSRLRFPLLPVKTCTTLTQFAEGDRDFEDVRRLYDAVLGTTAPQLPRQNEDAGPKDTKEARQDFGPLEAILSEIDQEALARITLPIDAARACYISDTVTVGSHEQFHQAIDAFFIHLHRHVHDTLPTDDLASLGADALALLERAWAKQGGVAAALAEAKTAINGGMRLVLDLLTAQFKEEAKLKHVERVFKETLDPLDWQGRVDLITALLGRLEADLPAEIRSAPPERFARHWEILVRAYVHSIDSMKSILRTL